MAAAAWTAYAEDITGDQRRWGDYLSAAALEEYIGARLAARGAGDGPAKSTILDALTRRPAPDDPRYAIYRPAARIGLSALAATPMWAHRQGDAYVELAEARSTTTTAQRRAKLPVYTTAEQAERGLASTEELARLLDPPRAENSLRRWQRENPPGSQDPYPPERGIAERQEPYNLGPTRVLFAIAEVQAWVDRTGRRGARPYEPGDPTDPADDAADDPDADRDATSAA